METRDLAQLERIRAAARRRAHELREEAFDQAWAWLLAWPRALPGAMRRRPSPKTARGRAPAPGGTHALPSAR